MSQQLRDPSTDFSSACCAVYSMWSNRSFKQPFLFAAFTCVLSNLLYCISYDWGGFALLGVARCITGLGEPLPHDSCFLQNRLPCGTLFWDGYGHSYDTSPRPEIQDCRVLTKRIQALHCRLHPQE